MAKQRKSKRQLVRDERRKKKRENELQDDEAREDTRDAKRQRIHEDGMDQVNGGNLYYEDDGDGKSGPRDGGQEYGGREYAVPRQRAGPREFPGSREYPESREYPGPEHAGPDYAGTGDPREFFGLLSEAEQEYFRRADELLELNEFDTPAERRVFLANVFREARGKELKLASSQSCSRLMERLMQLATTRQKKRLFGAFSTHFMTLVSHRFAGHCCEQLFLQSARAVGKEGTADDDEDEAEAEAADDNDDGNDKNDTSMEQHFLLVLDELEPHVSALLTDRFGSHALRVLLVVLSGRPLDQLATRTMMRSRKKEVVTVAGEEARKRAAASDGDASTTNAIASSSTTASAAAVRSVPPSFVAAVRKILADIVAALDPASLRVMATHPTGNPVLQLLLELEMGEEKKTKKGKEAKEEDDTLLGRLLPGAPASLSDPQSPAAELIRTLVYDRIGSRLLETLVNNSPGRLFKALYASTFAAQVEADDADESSKEKDTSTSFARPMAVYLRNDVACYPAIRVLERLGRDELVAVITQQILAAPTAASMSGRTAAPAAVVAQLVERQRFSVLRTLFVRCAARSVDQTVVRQLVEALRQAVGAERHSDSAKLITRLCLGESDGDVDESEKLRGGDVRDEKKEAAAVAHGCLLVTAMQAIPGPPAQAVQKSLLALSSEQLAHLATATTASAAIVITAIAATNSDSHSRSQAPVVKQLVARLVPAYLQLATSPSGHAVLVAIVQRPSRVADASAGASGGTPAGAFVAHLELPFHLKEAFVSQLSTQEDTLRACWPGRVVWRAWRIDLWRSRRADWIRWSKAGEPEGLQKSTAPLAAAAWNRVLDEEDGEST
ncbi:rRNA processing protein [Grosmannia clavigera kw1407]|uniref:Nucleolar protein 9 n=1 Tax=Grosmannia clavigera (strain kw1407 / UAMH 11150) TaxID=655863 RepID=F0XEJ4_GROCL|nr:rRNA processing protein [Grosmannia clavigera kw1407]EFX04094.1 rRNA processing protein [Grosmannia clavigera kw1407]